MHSMNAAETNKNLPLPVAIIIFVFVAAAGGIGGYMMMKKSPTTINAEKGASVQTDKAAGVADKKTFKDSAIGIMREGGIEGEGNFHLERTGGESQTAYLTSSTVDLSKYIGKKVTVWGQTLQGQKAGWLMDVGLVEIK